MDLDDEPAAAILPIAFHANTQQYSVAYSTNQNTSFPAVSGVPACSPEFDTPFEKEWPKKSSVVAEGPSTNNHDRSQLALKRRYSNTGEECRRVRSKSGASSEEPTTDATSSLSGFPDDARVILKDIPLFGIDNLKFSDMGSMGAFNDEPSAVTAPHFTSTSHQAVRDKCGTAVSYPFSSQTESFPVKVEPLDGHAPLDIDCTHQLQKNDAHTMHNGSCSVSVKIVSQEDIESAPSSSMGLHPENKDRNGIGGFSLQNGSIPTKTRSPATKARRSKICKTVKSWNGLPQQYYPAALQESNMGGIQAKRSVGRPRKERR